MVSSSWSESQAATLKAADGDPPAGGLGVPPCSDPPVMQKDNLEAGYPSSKEETTPPSTTVPAAEGEQDYPDGGLRAWLVVFGAALGSFVAWGYITSFGVYQSYYQNNQLASEGPSNISWIGSLQLYFILTGTLLAGFLFDAGYCRYILLTGSILQVAGIFLTAQCTELWHFILAQGICGGLGAGFIYLPCAACISHWFKLHRTLCFGIIASGSSVGGVLFPIILNRTFAQVGFKWGVRTAAFICLACMIAVNLLVKPRLTPRKRGNLVEFHHLKDPAYAMFVVGAFFINIGLYVPIFQIASFARYKGMDPAIAFYTVSVLNACSIFGRVVPNFFANKIGTMNIVIGATFLAGILSFIWIAIDKNASIFVFAGLYGIASGSYVSTMPAVVAIMTTRMNEIGARTSLAFGICAFAALAGPPAAGALIRINGQFVAPACFCGASVLLGVAIMLCSRRMLAKRMGTWRT